LLQLLRRASFARHRCFARRLQANQARLLIRPTNATVHLPRQGSAAFIGSARGG